MDVFGFPRAVYVALAFALMLLGLVLGMLGRSGPPKGSGEVAPFVIGLVAGAGVLAGLGWLVLTAIGRA